MLVTIITVCRNSESTIADTLRSVASQTYKNFEHLIIDGQSSDGTLNVIKKIGDHVKLVISEGDRGIYDAMNKGLSYSSGDVIGYLNSDDRYFNENVLQEIVEAFQRENYDYVYGDIKMVDRKGRIFRDWIVGEIPKSGLNGSQIPHPSFFVKTKILKKMPFAFDDSYKIAADLKQQLFIINKLNAKGFYLERPIVIMALGGESTKNLFRYLYGWKESIRAYNDVFGKGGIFFTIKKVFSKIRGIKPLSFFKSKS